MKVSEVAHSWGISQRSVYRLIREGILRATKVEIPKIIYTYDVDAALVLDVSMALAGDAGTRVTPVVEIRQVLKRLNSKEVHSGSY